MRQSTIFAAGLPALCLGFALGGPARADDWVSAGLDATHSHASGERSGSRFTAERWSRNFPANAYSISSPATADGMVVVGGHDGLIHAVAASDGRSLWSFATGGSVESSPAIQNGRVFVPSLDGKLYALHLADGQLAWQYELGGLEESSPLVVHDRLGDGVVIVRGFPGRTLLRLDAVSGEVVWETTPDILAQFSNSSAVSDGVHLVVGANEGHYYGFDLATGTRLWTVETDGIVNLSAPVIAQGRVFLLPGGESSKVHAVDVSTGQAIAGWPVELPAPAPSTTGKHLFRHYAVSSLATTPGRLIFDLRIDDTADTDDDTLADRFSMRESVVALSTIDGHLLWQTDNGQAVVGTFNDMPKSGMCPTPALYRSMPSGGDAFAVVTSTVDTTLQVVNTATGASVWSTALTSISRASPIFANGRLYVATDDGVLLSRASATNQAPSAPVFMGGTVRTVSDAAPAVEWATATDPEGDAVSYQLRLDRDGEVLQTWEGTASLSGDTLWRIPGTLKAGVSYIVAARARDSNGAWSDWSAPQFLDVIAAPPIAVNGTPVTNLGDALRKAQAGDIITLGTGTVVLTETLRVAGGVTLEGAGPQRTILDARGQAIAVSIDGSAAGEPSQVRGMTVTGARIGVSIGSTHDAHVSHVILRDNSDAGLDVGAAGTATLTNATLVSNGVGARSFGVLSAKNNLVLRNQTGFASDHLGALASRYNDVSGNTVDYQGLTGGTSDLAAPVTFSDFAKHDLHLAARQPTTDAGDPDDDFSAEPQPNGGRINLGAFGGTADAELSLAPSSSVGEPGEGPTPLKEPPEAPRQAGTTPPSATPEPLQHFSSDGGCSMTGESQQLSWPAITAAALVALALRHRRRTARVRFVTRRRWRGHACALGIALAIATLAASSVRAATMVWGGGNGTFSTAANWVGGSAPGSGDTVLFGGWAPLSRTSWTVTASLGTNPSYAKDGDRSTQWTANTGQASGQYVIVNLGSSQTFRHITMDSTTTSTDYPRTFDVYVSTDGSTWGSAVTSGTGSSSLVTVTLPANQTKQYIKIQLTGGSIGNWWRIGELFVYGVSETELSRNGWIASASATGGGASANAIDNDLTTKWSKGSAQTSGDWFSVDMGSAQTFTRIDMDANPQPTDYPRGYSVYVSSDGTNWGSAIASQSPTTAYTSITFSSQTKRYIKVQLTASDGFYWWALFDFKVYGTPANCNITSNTTVASMMLENSLTVTKSSAVTLAVSGSYAQSAGTFAGGNANMTVGGSFDLSGGTFTSTSALLELEGAFNKTGGTFTQTSGRVMLASTSNRTFAANSATFYDLIINDGLAGYWKLDEGSGSAAADASGYGLSGTLISSAGWETMSANLPTLKFTDSAAVTLNGTSQYVDTTGPATTTNAAYTACAWAKFSSLTGNHTLVSIDGTLASAFYLKRSSGGKFELVIAGSDVASPTLYYPTGQTTVPVTGTWYHVCGVYTGSVARVFVNGAQEGTDFTVTSTFAATGHTMIGVAKYNGSRVDYVPGTIDDVRIYSRVLSKTEINSLYLGNQPGTSVATQSMSGTATVSGNLTIASGGLYLSTNTINLAGNWWNYGGLFWGDYWAGATLNLTGSATTNYIRSAGQVLPTINITGSGKWTLADNLDVDPNGGITFTTGSMDILTRTLGVPDLDSGSGTLTASSGTVVLKPAWDRTVTASISGNVLRVEDPTETGLAGYWKLDEGQGTSARDWSGGGHSATLLNTPLWSSSVPSTIEFANSGSLKVASADSSYLRMGTGVTATNAAYSLCTWVNYHIAPSGYPALVSINGANVPGAALYRDTGGKFAADMRASDSTGATVYQVLGTTTTPTTNTWYHVCSVFDGSLLRLYVNGTAEGTPATVSATWNASGNATAGAAIYSAVMTNFSNAYLDDVRIYSAALTAAQVKALANGRYAGSGGTATVTLGANASAAGTFAIDSGGLNTFGSTLGAATGDATKVAYVSGGTLSVGWAAATFNGGLTVRNEGALTMATSGGSVNLASGKTLTIDGTLNASAATAATIQSVSGNYAFTVGSSATATPVLNVTKLAVKNTDTNGMNIDSVVGSSTTFTRFDNIAFSAGTGTQLLKIYAPSLYLVSNGCTFDTGTTATTTYPVTLTGDGSATETRAVFGGATCATNKTPCESYDNDNDAGDDGVGDTTATNAAVIQWVTAALADTNGTLEGYPVAAFDWSMFIYYSSYASYHDVDSGTADRVYVRNVSGATGSAIGAARYSWDSPSGVDLIGAPRFNTVSSVHYVYVATNAGRVYRLIDSGTSLTTDATWGSGSSTGYGCGCTIVSPLGMDTTNLYFTGTISTTSYVFDIAQATGVTASSYPKSLGSVTLTAAEPALWVGADTYTYLFAGLSGHFYKWSFNSGSVTTDNTTPTGTVNGRITILGNKVYGNDNAGTLWVLDPTTFSSTLWSYHDNTNHSGCSAGTACASTGGLYVDYVGAAPRVFYGDGDGHLYGSYNSTGTTGAQTNAGFPYQPGGVSTTDVFATPPLYINGVLVAGTTLGTVYVLDTNNGTTGPAKIQTYKFGTSTRISGIGYDASTSSYLIATSNATNKDGKLFYIAASTDPTALYW